MENLINFVRYSWMKISKDKRKEMQDWIWAFLYFFWFISMGASLLIMVIDRSFKVIFYMSLCNFILFWFSMAIMLCWDNIQEIRAQYQAFKLTDEYIKPTGKRKIKEKNNGN